LGVVIRGFRDKKTELLFAGENVKEFSGIRKVAERTVPLISKTCWPPGETAWRNSKEIAPGSIA
jgi:hypothetical protein